jgi:glycosyltransferase involved in cell wall biosynthesis
MKDTIPAVHSLVGPGLRVAYVCADPGVPIFGSKGASVHAQEVLSSMRRLGVTITLFASSIDGKTPPDLDEIEVHQLPNMSESGRVLEGLSIEEGNNLTRSLLEQWGPFDLVYERYSLWSYAGMEYAESKRTLGLLEVNAPLIREQAAFRVLGDRAGAEDVARRTFRTATHIFAVSNGVAQYLASFSETSGKVHVTGNGVNPARFPVGINPSRPAGPGIFTVGFVGSLKPWHGLNVLADAYEIIHDKASETRLLIVGDGPERNNLTDYLKRKNLLVATEFTGPVSPSEVPALMASMDVGVAPYPDIDDFYFSPLKVYEYMAAGIPVVASRIGDLPRLIQDGINGFLVAPGDPAALAEAFERLRLDSGLRVRLGSEARSLVLQSRTWDAIVKGVLNLARGTVSSDHSGRRTLDPEGLGSAIGR